MFKQRENIKQMIANQIKTKKCNSCEHVAKTLTELSQHMKATHDEHFGTKALNQKLEKIEERISD